MTQQPSTTPIPPGGPPRSRGHRANLKPVTLAVPTALAVEQVEKERLAALVFAQQAIATADLDLHALVHLIVERVQQLTGASGAAIALAEGANLVYHHSCPELYHVEERWLPEDLLSERLWRCDEPARPGAACSRLVLPLRHHQQLVGVLEVLSPLAHAFDDREIQTLQLLEGLLAAVLSRAREFETSRALVEKRTAELRESELRFESAFTFSAFGMACLAPDGRFLQVNPALCALLGQPEEELLHGNLHSLTHLDDRAWNLVYLDRLLQGELRNYQLEQRYLLPNGRLLWALLSVSLVRDLAGQPHYLIAQFQDMTAHKHLQERCEELQKMESFARTLGRLPAELSEEGVEKVAGASRRRRSTNQESPFGQSEREWAFEGWYCKRGERIVGPLSRSELCRLLDAGKLRARERVWERWKRGLESFLVPTTARAACVS